MLKADISVVDFKWRQRDFFRRRFLIGGHLRMRYYFFFVRI